MLPPHHSEIHLFTCPMWESSSRPSALSSENPCFAANWSSRSLHQESLFPKQSFSCGGVVRCYLLSIELPLSLRTSLASYLPRHRNPLLVAANSLEPRMIARRQECLRVPGPNLVRGPRASIISSMAPQPCPHSRNHSASPWPSRVTWFYRTTFAPTTFAFRGQWGGSLLASWSTNNLNSLIA